MPIVSNDTTMQIVRVRVGQFAAFIKKIINGDQYNIPIIKNIIKLQKYSVILLH